MKKNRCILTLKIGNLTTHKTIMEVKTQFLHFLMEAKAGFWVVTRPNRQMYKSDNKYACILIHSTLYTTLGILNLFWPLKWFYTKVIWRNFNSWARASKQSKFTGHSLSEWLSLLSFNPRFCHFYFHF